MGPLRAVNCLVVTQELTVLKHRLRVSPDTTALLGGTGGRVGKGSGEVRCPTPQACSVPSAALAEPQLCYILDSILFVYGIVLTVLYCRLKVRLAGGEGCRAGGWRWHGFEGRRGSGWIRRVPMSLQGCGWALANDLSSAPDPGAEGGSSL